MDPITARQSLAQYTLERNFPDQPPYNEDKEYLKWVKKQDNSTTNPIRFSPPPSFLVNLFLNGARYLKYGKGHPTVFTVRKPPLDTVTSSPDFVSDHITRDELQVLLDKHIRDRTIIEQPIPHDMPHEIRTYLMEAGYAPTVPPQADPTLYRNGIVFDEVDRVVFLTPGNLAELLTNCRTIAGYEEEPVYIRMTRRKETLQDMMSKPGRKIEVDISTYSPDTS